MKAIANLLPPLPEAQARTAAPDRSASSPLDGPDRGRTPRPTGNRLAAAGPRQRPVTVAAPRVALIGSRWPFGGTRVTGERPVIGWREWVQLPDLLDLPIKAKIDSGARTSSLHSFGTRPFVERGTPWVEFQVHPLQRRRLPEIGCVAPVVDERLVRSSNGESGKRLVIETRVRIGDLIWPIELTLADRDVMGFRMLLGRAAVRGRFLIDPGGSFRRTERPSRSAGR